MKRKILAVLLLGCMLLSGCGAQKSGNEKKITDKIEVTKSDDDIMKYYAQSQPMEDEVCIEDEAVALSSGTKAALSYVVTPKASGKNVKENDDMIIDYSNVSDGYVMVKYKKSTSVKIKSQVKGPKGVVYTYNLTPKKWATFPLTEGNGKYYVYVYRNVKGNMYASVGAHDFNVHMDDTMAPFKSPNQYVDYTSKSLCVKKAAKLCKGTTKEMSKVKKIYNWTLSYFKYDKKKAKTVKSGYLPNLDKVYKAKKGICFDYASTMVAMLRSQKVPAKLVIGYAGKVYHAWINVYTKKTGWVTGAIYFDGKNWNLMDPTFADSGNSSKEIMDYISNGANYTEKYVY